MKQILTVFGYTLREGLRKKSFLVSTVIVLAVILIACVLARVLNDDHSDVTTDYSNLESSYVEDLPTQEPTREEATAYYLDEANSIPEGLAMLREWYPSEAFIAIDPSEEADIRAKIAAGEAKILVKVSDENGLPNLTIVVESFLSSVSTNAAAEALTEAYVTMMLEQMGLDEAASRIARTKLSYRTEAVGQMDVSGYAVGLILTMLMFFSVYFYGYGVAMSVATEKTSRVMETLVVSAKPSRILIGKCLAMGLLGLIQMSVFIGFAAISYKLIVPSELTLMGMPLSFSAFTWQSALLILLYFLLGYALYAMLNAVCGASVSKIEDVNTAMMPVVFLAMIGFYVGYFSSAVSATVDSGSLIEALGTYVPFCSPFKIPFALLNGGVEASELALSLGILAVSVLLVSLLSIRVYSASVLRYGNRLRLKDMLKMSREKTN